MRNTGGFQCPAQNSKGEAVRMKIKIELDSDLKENEIIIRCSSLTEDIQRLQQVISDAAPAHPKMSFYKGDTQYFLELEDILFFETQDKCINVHTAKDIFQTKQKLYELEELLPRYFMRISKSVILNTRQVYSIHKNIAASSVVEFFDCHKQVYVSRNYYKALIHQIEMNHYHKDRTN